jgi:hypothetical protein
MTLSPQAVWHRHRQWHTAGKYMYYMLQYSLRMPAHGLVGGGVVRLAGHQHLSCINSRLSEISHAQAGSVIDNHLPLGSIIVCLPMCHMPSGPTYQMLLVLAGAEGFCRPPCRAG